MLNANYTSVRVWWYINADSFANITELLRLNEMQIVDHQITIAQTLTDKRQKQL